MKLQKLWAACFAAMLLACSAAGAEQKVGSDGSVLWQDPEYMAQLKKSGALKASDAGAENAAAARTGAEGNPLSDNYLFIVIALGLVGFAFWSATRSKSTTSITGGTYMGGSDGETGVAKYLSRHVTAAAEAVADTGVAKYLRRIQSS